MTHSPLPVLIVDDYHLLRQLMTTMLKRTYPILTASDGETALQVIETTPVLAVILDIDLPGLSGWDVLARVRAEPSLLHVPVILLTAQFTNHGPARAKELGAIAYLRKPAQMETLQRLLREIAHTTRDRAILPACERGA